MTKTISYVTPLLLAALVAVPACKKKESAPPKKASPDSMATGMNPRPAPVRRRAPAQKEVVLPIPADLPAIRFNVERLRETAWFKKQEAGFRTLLTKQSALARALIACKMDPITGVEGATVGMAFDKGPLGDMVVILKIERLASEVVGCVKKQFAAKKIAVKDLTVAGRTGISARYADRDAALIALRKDQLMLCTGELHKRVRAVLEGKAPSIASTKLYKQVNKQVGPDTLFGGIIPGLPGEMGKGLPPFLKNLKTGALLMNLPKGQAAMRISLKFEDAKQAAELSKVLPGLLQLAGARYPGVKGLAKGLKVRSERSWAYLEFKMEERTFDSLMELVKGLLVTEQTPAK